MAREEERTCTNYTDCIGSAQHYLLQGPVMQLPVVRIPEHSRPMGDGHWTTLPNVAGCIGMMTAPNAVGTAPAVSV